MNSADGMSREELDFWAELFYQAKIGDVTTATFSEFISEPFTHLNAASHAPKSKAVHLTLVSSNPPGKNPYP